jgi:uncharacterized repeat protein (TIGR01451 family)
MYGMGDYFLNKNKGVLMAKIENQSFIDIESCEETFSLDSNKVEVIKIDLEIEKMAGCRYVAPNGEIKWCTTIKNHSGVAVEDLLFRDVLAAGTSYVAGSFTVNGTPVTPSVSGQTIIHPISKIENGETVVICFKVRLT